MGRPGAIADQGGEERGQVVLVPVPVGQGRAEGVLLLVALDRRLDDAEQGELEAGERPHERLDGDATRRLKALADENEPLIRARSLDHVVRDEAEFLDIGFALLRSLLPPVKAIRLLGLGLSGLTDLGEAPAAPLELELPL